MRGIQMTDKEIATRREVIKASRVRTEKARAAKDAEIKAEAKINFDTQVDAMAAVRGCSKQRAELIIRGLVNPG